MRNEHNEEENATIECDGGRTPVPPSNGVPQLTAGSPTLNLTLVNNSYAPPGNQLSVFAATPSNPRALPPSTNMNEFAALPSSSSGGSRQRALPAPTNGPAALPFSQPANPQLETATDDNQVEDGLEAPLLQADAESGELQAAPTAENTTTALMRAPSRALASINRRLPRALKLNAWTAIAVGGTIAAAATGSLPFIPQDMHGGNHNNDAGNTQRLHCAARLSNIPVHAFEKEHGTPHAKVVDWFTHGKGRAILVPDTDEDCTWESDFGQTYALMMIRESLEVNDDSWHPVHVMVEAADACHWSRVQCDAQDKVIGLFLGQDTLLGSLPDELFGLRHLETLHVLANPKLVGTISTLIGGLSRLKELHVHKTSIQGTIPTELGSLTRLATALFHETQLKGDMPSEVCDLKNRGTLKQLEASCQLVPCPCCICAPS